MIFLHDQLKYVFVLSLDFFTDISHNMDHEILRKQIMVNQFCNQVGCTPEQATEILQTARWQIEVLSIC